MAALRSTISVGYGVFHAVPEKRSYAGFREACGRDSRVVAIDLRGPFVVDGACINGNGGVETFGIRGVVIPDVRLAAYARISYGR